MPKTAVIMREKKRIKTYLKFKTKRDLLLKTIKELQLDPSGNYDMLQQNYLELRAMPRNASRSRIRNRCQETGRPRGFYRKVGLSRNMFRLRAMRGEIPGLRKSSW